MDCERGLADFEHLWDGSQEWVLTRHEHDAARIIIRFTGGLQPRDLAAIRMLLPEFQNLPPTDVKRRLLHQTELSLGPLPTREALDLAQRAAVVGLEAGVVDASYTDYQPLQRTDAGVFALIIEDNDFAQRVCQRMLKAGVPVVNARSWLEGASASEGKT
jgi:hypothetical protein